MIKERLREISELKKQLCEIQARQRRLLAPLIEDYALLSQLLNVFLLTNGIVGAMTKWERRQFFFVVLWFCSPESLVKGVMHRGLRGATSKLLDCPPTQLSKYIPTLAFYYLNYPQFRDSVDTVTEIVNRIMAKEGQLSIGFDMSS